MRSAVILAIGALAPLSLAQTNILPTSANGVAGSTSNAFPWGSTAATFPGLRIMCLYDSTNFTAAPAPITTPILITNVRWRANDVATNWTGGTFLNATLSLGTAAVDHAAATTAWASNVGPDYTQVYNGPVTVQPGPGNGAGVPGPFHVDIALHTPFLYDPNLGDLVVDTDFLTGAWLGGTQVALDVTTVTPLARRVFASSMYPNANGVDSSAPVIEVAFTPVSGTVGATSTPLGAGCLRTFASVYEVFATSAAFDLANNALTFIPNAGGGYDVALGGAFLPVGSTSTPTTLTLADNAQVTQTFTVGTFPGWTAMTICSNGFISRATGNGTTATPTLSTVLGGSQTAWWSWHDYNPALAGGGPVVYEESANQIVVTWNGVWDALGTSAANANNLQFQFSPTGAVTIAWGAMSGLGGSHIVGYSPGGANQNPGATDLSALAATISLSATDVLALHLNTTARPVTGGNWNLSLTNIPVSGALGVEIFGLSDPGINDLFFLGMPGCGLRSSLDVLGVFVIAGSSHSYGLAIPASPALVNAHLYTTTAVFQAPPVNAFGAITSNGVDGKIGDM